MEPIQRHPATSGGLNGVEASVFSLTQIVVNRMTNEFSFSFAFYSLFVPLRDERKIDFLIAADRWNGNSRSKLHILANNGDRCFRQISVKRIECIHQIGRFVGW